MKVKIENQFRAPYGVPNGLQLTDDGLWIVDQMTDRVALMSMKDEDKDDYYGNRRLLRDIPSESLQHQWHGRRRWIAVVGGKWPGATLAAAARDRCTPG